MDKCNLCGGTDWKAVESVGERRVVRCACGLVFVTPPPSRVLLEQAYDETYYRPWEGQEVWRSRIWGGRMRRVESVALPPGKLLDVGCATGAFLHAAKTRGWSVTGTEFSPFAVKTAREQGLPVVQGELWEAGFPADAFDVVTCWHVVEHTTDPSRLIREIHRVLRPGGWLVLAVPNVEDHIFRAAYLLARLRRPRLYEPDEREIHLFHFSGRTLRMLVSASGLDVVGIGFDRGAAAVWRQRVVNEPAYLWYKLTGLNWGMALELFARKPALRGC